MKFGRLAAICLLGLSLVAATDVAPTKAELESMYDRAFRAFDASKYDDALKELDAIDARKPDLAESQNLRGVILTRQGVYDKAEAALSEALRLDPKFWNARFNLAEIPFLKKEWAEARKRFEEMLSSDAADLQGEATQLIQYKILLTYLMEGNDKMVDSVLSKFELSSETPAVQYANAAIALQHQKIEDAKTWMATAEKNFSPELNKLFAESFFGLGWLQRQPGQPRAVVQLLAPGERAAKKSEVVRTKFEEAQVAFEERNFENAAKLAEAADAAEPNKAPTLNLRGEIALEEQKEAEAENFFNRALKADKNFREAQFNLADLPFRKKDYAKARTRFEILAKQTPGGEKNQAIQLIRFKIFMTYLLEGKDSRAQKAMEQFQFSGDTPALYYAQAAWEFQHGNNEKAKDWIASARKIYPLAANTAFGGSFYELGWLKSTVASTSPAPGSAAVAASGNDSAPPAVEPSPIPGVEAKAEEAAPALTLAQNKPVPGVEATVSVGAKLPPASDAFSASTAPIVAASATPPPAVPSIQPPALIQEAPVPNANVPAVANNAPPASPGASASTTPAPVSVTAANVVPATVLAPGVHDASAPRLGERLDRMTGPKPLLIVLLGGGVIALGAWFLIPRVRGTFSRVRPALAGGANVPLTENGSELSRGAGPRRVSLHLKASEPSLRRGAVPLVKRGPVEVPPVLESATLSNGHAEVASDFAEPEVGEVIEQPAVPSETVEAVAPAEMAPVIPTVLNDPLIEQPVAFEPALAEMAAASTGPVMAASELGTVQSFVPPSPELPAEMKTEEHVAEGPAPNVREGTSEIASEPVFQGQPIPLQTVVSTPTEEVAAPETEAAEDFVPAPASQTPPLLATADAKEPVGMIEPLAQIPDEPAITTIPSEDEIPPEWSAAGLLSGLASASHIPSIAEEFQSQPTNTMPDTQSPAAPVIRTPAPQPNAPVPASGGTPQVQPGGMQTAVQITFSCEIASMQLTSSFKMGALQLRPISKVVSMRLAPSQQQQGAPMNLQVNFEVVRVQPGQGTLGQMRLNPSQQQKPPSLGTPSFNISGLQLIASQEAAPVQLTPQQQGQASVHVTAAFQITTVEFSQSFDIAGIILNSTGRTVLVQLPGTGAGTLESAPAFEIANVQLGPNGEIVLMQLTPAGMRRA